MQSTPQQGVNNQAAHLMSRMQQQRLQLPNPTLSPSMKGKLLMNQLQQQHAMMANQSRLAEYYNMLKFNMEQERLKKAQIEQQEKLQQFHQKMLLNSMLQRQNPMVSDFSTREINLFIH